MTIEPALTPTIRLNEIGPRSMNASITPAVNAQRKLPPSRIKVSKRHGISLFGCTFQDKEEPRLLQKPQRGQEVHVASVWPKRMATPKLA